MVLVDSSVWIAYLGQRVSAVEARLESLIRPDNQVVITGIVFQEVLQGIPQARAFELTHELMGRLPFLLPSVETHRLAAELFRKFVKAGRVCSSIDVLIAALAIEHRCHLFTLDRDFHYIAEHSKLELHA